MKGFLALYPTFHLKKLRMNLQISRIQIQPDTLPDAARMMTARSAITNQRQQELFMENGKHLIGCSVFTCLVCEGSTENCAAVVPKFFMTEGILTVHFVEFRLIALLNWLFENMSDQMTHSVYIVWRRWQIFIKQLLALAKSRVLWIWHDSTTITLCCLHCDKAWWNPCQIS